MKEYIHSLSPELLRARLAEWGQPPFRTRQVWQWLYVQRVEEWSGMANIPQALRERLAAHFEIRPVCVRASDLDADGAGKLLLGLVDGNAIETAVIPAAIRRTVCVSSQVGCRFKCGFCASGMKGFLRNLDAGEMVGQVLAAAHVFAAAPTHVVFMGIGEPLDNPDALERTLTILNDPHGFSIGARRMTVSTCGVVPGIRWLAGLPLQIELSVSLHAPDDQLRSRLMPVNRKYPIDLLLAECKAFYLRTKRLITFEYTLIEGVNDSVAQASLLVRRLISFPARVNLIPLSVVPEFDGRCPTLSAQRRFMQVLQQAGINVTIRASRGAGVAAACGQLRLRD